MSHAGRVTAAAVAVTALASLVPPAYAAPPDPMPQPGLVERFEEAFQRTPRTVELTDGDVFGRWRVVFDGSRAGAGVVVRRHHLLLDPEPVTNPWQTRSALVVSRRSFGQTAVHVAGTWTTLHQNRAGTPNPWEVGWLIWDYRSPARFTYLVLKPNGWEIGRRDPTQPGGQRFLATGDGLVTPLGVTRTAIVDRVGTQTTVRVDGQVLATVDVAEGETGGAVGMYTEDALVDFRRMYVATSPD